MLAAYQKNVWTRACDVMENTTALWKRTNRTVVSMSGVLHTTENQGSYLSFFAATCGAGQFPCVLSEQCIDFDKRCNGVKECKDGTDEQHCDGNFFALLCFKH